MKRRLNVCSVAILLLVLLPAAVFGSGAKDAAATEQKAVVIIYGTGDFSIMDTQRHSSGVLSSVLGNIYDPLVGRNPDGKFIPMLATSWKRIDDYTVELALRKGVTFHNGEPFNAAAVKFTIERSMDEVRLVEHQHSAFKILAGAEIVDDYTIRVKTTEPDPVLVNKMASNPSWIVPPAYLKEKGDDFFAANPVGTGPYKFVSYAPDGDLVFEANPDYWGGKPAIDRVIWRVVPETGARMAELQAGTADVVVNVPYDQIDMLDADPNINVMLSRSIRTPYLQLDNQVEPTNNRLVRLAIHHAIDIESIIKNLLKGRGKRVATYHIPEVAFFNPNLVPRPYDVKKARELLVEAGYGDKLPIKMTFDCIVGRTPMDKEVVQAVTGQLNESGLFDVNLIINESGVFTEKASFTGMPRKVGQITIYSHGNSTLDPDFTLSRSFGLRQPPYVQLTSHQDNQEIDALIKEAARETNEDERGKKYWYIQEYLYERCPRIFLYQQMDAWGVNPKLDWQPTGESIDLTTMKWK